MRMGNGIHNSPVKMSIEHAYLGREMCHAANTCNTKNCCGQYFGRYNAVWSIFGWYLIDIWLIYRDQYLLQSCSVTIVARMII